MKFKNGNNYTAEQAKRDTNPTAPAIVANALYNERYAKKGLGMMGFFDSLSYGEKKTCERIAEEIKKAPMTE